MYILLDGVTHTLGRPTIFSSKVWWTLCGRMVLPEGKETPLKRATCSACDVWETERVNIEEGPIIG